MDVDIVRRPPFGSNPLVGERGSDTRNRILEAALDVFGDLPYPDDDVLARWALLLDDPEVRNLRKQVEASEPRELEPAA